MAISKSTSSVTARIPNSEKRKKNLYTLPQCRWVLRLLSEAYVHSTDSRWFYISSKKLSFELELNRFACN